ncbi:MAG: L-rhamnose mutarotase [Planctomycetota bacterium]
MPRYCFTLQVKPDRLDAYRAAHEDVWPDMLDVLRRHGWRNYSLYLRDDGLLIGVTECDDLDAAVKGMADEPVNTRWQAAMLEYFESLEHETADRSLTVLPEVFHLA